MPSTSADRHGNGPTADEWIGPAVELVVWGRRLGRVLAGVARKQGLNETQFQVVWLLGSRVEPVASQTELARELALSPAQVSGLLEELRRRGLVTGRSPRGDRRRREWRLTPAGFACRIAVASRLAQEVPPVEPSSTEAAARLLRSQEEPSPVRLRPFVAECDGPGDSHGDDRPPAAVDDREGDQP